MGVRGWEDDSRDRIYKIGMMDVELAGGEACDEPILLCAFVPLGED